MKPTINRREFSRTLAFSAAAATLPTSLLTAKKLRNKKCKIKVGYTGITWPNSEMVQAISDVSGEGFYGFETFGEVFGAWEENPAGWVQFCRYTTCLSSPLTATSISLSLLFARSNWPMLFAGRGS